MNKKRLQDLLDAETNGWSRKSIDSLVKELTDVVSYGRGSEDDFHQFEVQMIEQEPDYVHVIVSIDDGSFLKSFAPLTRGFIVHRDGRVDN
ncbi:MAG: hypothetical protein HKN11_11700 [Rhizobiales bacterium]|nr:hypothetical protein [Hyphomicrobiales bacterium]